MFVQHLASRLSAVTMVSSCGGIKIIINNCSGWYRCPQHKFSSLKGACHFEAWRKCLLVVTHLRWQTEQFLMPGCQGAPFFTLGSKGALFLLACLQSCVLKRERGKASFAASVVGGGCVSVLP